MKKHHELPKETYLLCPVEKGGEVWIELNYYGTPTLRALDKTLELLTEMRNGFADDIREGSK